MKTEGQNQRKRFFIYAAGILLGIVGIGVLIFRFLFPLVLNEGRAMEPTIAGNAYFFVNPFAYLSSEPQRGDIIVFNSANPVEAEVGVRLVKRILGLPGESIEFRQQQLFINGTVYDEPYLAEPCGEYNCPDESWILDEDEYFVMGDNRNHSRDSRSFGAISRELIIGKAIIP